MILGAGHVAAIALWAFASAGPLVAPLRPSPITGGEPATTGFDQVVKIQGGLMACSGVMVTPTLALTAAHCLDELDVDDAVGIYRGPETATAMVYQGSRWGIHPDYCPSCDERTNDFAYIELLAGFEPAEGIGPPVGSTTEWDELMRVDTEVTVVGYGDTDDDGNGSGIRRKVDLQIEALVDGGAEFSAGGHGKSGCEGDSGGPAFARLADGARRLIGIYSRSYGCGDVGLYVAPYPSLCWLRDETSVDFLSAECSACDCIDLSESGCACDVRDDAGRTGALFLAALLWLRRRAGAARSGSRSAADPLAPEASPLPEPAECRSVQAAAVTKIVAGASSHPKRPMEGTNPIATDANTTPNREQPRSSQARHGLGSGSPANAGEG